MNPVRKAIRGKPQKRPSREELLEVLVRRLQGRKPVFQAHRVQGEVRIDKDGTTVGRIQIEEASANVGLALKVKREWGGLAMPVIYAKEGQHERKKCAVICAFLMYLFDDRPSEERQKSLSKWADPKIWFESFSDSYQGEITDSFKLYQDLTQQCRTLIDVFSCVGDAMKSARGQDTKEAVDRVKKELPFLVGKLTAEEWLELFNTTVVDQVHEV